MCIGNTTPPPPPVAPPPPPAPPTRDDPEMTAAQRSARRRNILARGRAPTLLTGGEGVTEEANLGMRNLLGG